jgi:MFS transporter, DHA1 family, inner membrane transport protein
VELLRSIDADPSIARGTVLVTAIRLTVVALLRFTPPFLATMADDIGVRLVVVASGLAIAELVGLASPLIGRQALKTPRIKWFRMAACAAIVGAIAVATTASVWQLALGLAIVSAANAMVDVGMGDWIAHHVPYERRGRVNGISQFSWAGSFLIGVPIMAIGVVAVSWRLGLVIGMVAVALMAVLIGRLPVSELAEPTHQRVHITWNRNIVLLLGAIAALAGSSQHVFVTFSSWLTDTHRFSNTQITIVTVGIGVAELAAATSTIWLTDHYGKRVAMLIGVGLMVPGAVILAVGADQLVVGLIGLVAIIAGFEFAIISSMPWVAELDPRARAELIGWSAGVATLARSGSALLSAALYEQFDMRGAALSSAAIALISGALAWSAREPHARSTS